MKKSVLLSESSSKPKNPLRAVEGRNEKPQQHRYERRKVRQFLRGSDWLERGARGRGRDASICLAHTRGLLKGFLFPEGSYE